ncbi:MAG TPA: N-methyl-L-tryptophan oxidase [Agriterribacter sp.]|nr:N-methyl-L-tryptophan oxidase [Agriterribacter sp.]
MHSNNYDVIVIGAGSMGAAASWYLARRGYKILGLEQFDIPHELGSHAGQSRIIRKAYFEHSDYVPLLERAYHNWRELEETTSSQVYHKTGLVYFGNPGAALVKGTKKSAHQYNIPLEVLSPAELMSRYPMFNCPMDYQVLFEPDAGFVTPEKVIALYLSDAVRHNADIRAREQVTGWKKEGTTISVTTTRNIFHADHLVITAGAWTQKIIPSLPATLKVTKQIVGWLKPRNWNDFSLGNFPCWFLSDEDETLFYGFPILPAKDFGGPIGLKLAMHKHGAEVDPDRVDRNVQQQEEEILRSILEKYIPGAAGNALTLKSCLYTNTRDENFIIDYLPGYDNKITVACGFSGHGFKFASVVGEILADLAVAGKTDLPVEFLRLNRFVHKDR